MGYFAVVAQVADKAYAPHLSVKRLHVNIWALRGLWFGRRIFFFDVGVELSLEDPGLPDDVEIGAVELLLPFRVEEGKWPGGAPVAQDLYGSVVDDHSGPLIFGSPVSVVRTEEDRSVLAYEGHQLPAVRISEMNIKAVPDHPAKADSSLYTVPLRQPIKKGETSYFRVRWRVFGAAPMWRWARPESGARVDFRVCDTRQGRPSERNPAFLARVLEVQNANVFVMAPSRLRPTNVSPVPKHIRTLEPGAWTDYLKGAAAREWPARDLLVYGWHHKSEVRHFITKDDPFRVFLALNRPAGTPAWLSVSYAALGFALVWAVLAMSGPISELSLKNLDAKSWLSLAGVGSLTAGWALLQRMRPYLSDRARRSRQFLRRIERFFLSL